jgi:hypothetical protein
MFVKVSMYCGCRRSGEPCFCVIFFSSTPVLDGPKLQRPQ